MKIRNLLARFFPGLRRKPEPISTRMTARFEKTVGVIRVYAPDAPPPASYIMSVVVVADQGVASVRALSMVGLNQQHYAVIRDCLRDQGFHTMEWTRRNKKTGKMRRESHSTGLDKDDPRVNKG